MSNLIYNERLKLWATYCNNVSVGVFLGGFLLPALAERPTSFLRIFIFACSGIIASFGLHIYARYVVLGRMEE
jgi:hypothetical protein